jgi:hypothetical protein
MKATALLAAATVALAPLAQATAAEAPSELVAKACEAAGGLQAFAALGVLKMDISQVQTYADGSQDSLGYTAYVDTGLGNSRVELPGEIVNVRNGDTGWAMVQGQPDRRQQTPRIAPGFNHERILPLLLPFSLNLEGVLFGGSVDEVVFAKKPVLKLSFTVPEMFFASPLMGLQWDVLVDPADHHLVAARFLPVEGFAEAKNEGLQIEIAETQSLGGVSIPKRVTMKGINSWGQATGMEREITITASVLDEPSPALFIRPDKLEAMEGD